MKVGYYNGEFKSLEDIRIPLTDRSIYFGDGVYDAAIGRCGKTYLAEEHIDRFIRNAQRLDITLNYTKSELINLTDEAVRRSGEDCFFLYYQLSRKSESRRHAYTCSDGANLLITVKGCDIPDPRKRLKLVTYEDRRYSYCDIKTLNLLPSVLASGYAEALGADEAVFHRGNTVTECAHSNVSIIKGGRLYTHPTNEYILAGTSRAKLLEKCTEMKIEFLQRPFTLDMLYTADEVLVSSSSKLCVLADRVNCVTFPIRDDSIGSMLCNAMYEDFIKSTDI